MVTPEELAGYEFAAKTGRRAAIGSLAGIAGIVAGTVGTNVVTSKTAEDAGSDSPAGEEVRGI